MNLEVCYHGIKMVGHTLGNVFNTIISNNYDKNGAVLDTEHLAAETAKYNRIISLYRRTTINGGGDIHKLSFRDLYPTSQFQLPKIDMDVGN